MNITTLSELQRDFNSELEKTSDKKFIIDNEIEQVINYANTIPVVKTNRKPLKPTFINKSNKVFKIKISVLSMSLFNEAFYQNIHQGEYQIKRFDYDTDDTFSHNQLIVKQASEFSEYFKWLRSLQTSPQETLKKASSLTHKQKLLALHYLGLDISKYDNTKIAKILSEVLELNEDNTRQYLSYLSAGKNDVRTKSNLEKVKHLFDNQGLNEISTTIKKDIEKL